MTYNKWVACWGVGTSFFNQKEARFSKDLTLRYPLRMCFSGEALRLHFTNYTGTEPVHLRVSVARALMGNRIEEGTSCPVTVKGETEFSIEPGTEITSDEIPYMVHAGETLMVSIYLPTYTDMNAGVLVTGPQSKGYYAYGEYLEERKLPQDKTRNTNWYFFLNTIDILTEEKNHALVCFGDSITAQSWPDYLAMRAWKEGYRNVSIIRRAVCGTRILRQYDCTTYADYGLKGATRFPLEMNVAGARDVIIQHGINDIIHPVGREINVFRPWSDLPTVKALTDGVTELYIQHAKTLSLHVYGGTLLPIYGWRTYEKFREDMKNEYNRWIRESGAFDGVIDFDLAVRDPEDMRKFAPGFDSGDHLHPSEAAYEAMANAVPAELLI